MGKGASPSPFFFGSRRGHDGSAGTAVATGVGPSRIAMADRLEFQPPMSDIQSLTTQALADVAAAQSPDVLEQLRVALLLSLIHI